MPRVKPSAGVTRRVRQVLRELGYIEGVDWEEEVEIRLYGPRRLWADLMVFEGEIPVAVVEVEASEKDLEMGRAEAVWKAIAWNPEDPVPLIWVAAGQRDVCYQAQPVPDRPGVRYELLSGAAPQDLFAPDRLMGLVSGYLERQGAAEREESQARQSFEQGFRRLPRRWDPHRRCREIVAAVGKPPRGRGSRALQKIVSPVRRALRSGRPHPVLARAFRWQMRHYFRPLTSGRSDPVRQRGRYFTPTEVCRFLVEALDPRPEEHILDPACGSGGFLVEVARYLQEKHSITPVLTGWDIDPTCVQMAQVVVALALGCQLSQVDVQLRDSLGSAKTGTWDIILCNPPAGNLPSSVSLNDENYQFVGKGKGRYPLFELAFIEQVLRLTRSDGRIGLIVPDDVLTGLRLKRFREWLLRKQVTLQAVVGLPRGLFPATLSKMSAVVMQKGQPPRGHRTLVAEVSRRDMRAQLRDIVEEIRKKQGRV